MERFLLTAFILLSACDPGGEEPEKDRPEGDTAAVSEEPVPVSGDWELVDVVDYTEDCGFMEVLGARMDRQMLGLGSFASDIFLRYRVVPTEDGAFEISNKLQESGTQCVLDGRDFVCDDIVDVLYVSEYTRDFTMDIRWSGTFDDDDQIRGALEVDLQCGAACGSYNRAGFDFPCTIASELLLAGPASR